MAASKRVTSNHFKEDVRSEVTLSVAVPAFSTLNGGLPKQFSR